MTGIFWNSHFGYTIFGDASRIEPIRPVQPGLTNDIFGPYVGDAGFDPAGFAKNQRLLPWCSSWYSLRKQRNVTKCDCNIL